MGAFYAVRRDAPELGRRLAAAFVRQGHGPAEVLRGRHWEVVHFPERPSGNTDDGPPVALAGTLFYRGAFGAAAGPELRRDLRTGRLDLDRLWGSFAVAMLDGEEVRLFTDPGGTFHLFAERGGRAVSTSFLALAEALPALTPDAEGIYDYVFQGAPHGGGTVFAEIALVDAGGRVDLGHEARFVPAPAPALPAVRPAALDDHAGLCLTRLRARVADIAAAFGDRVDTALSGGYDSRLILALLREQGVRPRVHVYGRADDPDVEVARRIAAGEGFALHHVDKSAHPPLPPDAMPAAVVRHCVAFDGCPNDGLFNNGADLATRRERAGGGALMLNGGGGEVFRNFYHLPDRPLSARALVWSFHAQFDPAAAAPPFDADAYLDGLAERLRRSLGADSERLSRVQVEAAYPRFRCRWWMGRNNSVNNRFGFAVTPFVDPWVVGAALAVPLAWKDAGRLEARMIALADARLAAYPSAYGHDFDRPPPLRPRLAEWLNQQVPPWLRRRRAQAKRRRPAPLPPHLSPAHVAAVLGPRFEIMDRFFRVDRLRDPEAYNRVCTLEYLFRRLNVGAPPVEIGGRARSFAPVLQTNEE